MSNTSPADGFVKFSLVLIVISFCVSGAAFAATTEHPCAAISEARQLDYWLGDWTIGNGANKSTSHVSLSLDKCVFLEHWENGNGHAAEKMLAYTPEEKNWYGMFADNEGRVHVFTRGKVSADSAEFQGESRGAQGEAVLNRLKVVRLSADKLEEVWEKSKDNGSTWTTAYRVQYSRATP
jgi:hypothetical protein